MRHKNNTSKTTEIKWPLIGLALNNSKRQTSQVPNKTIYFANTLVHYRLALSSLFCVPFSRHRQREREGAMKACDQEIVITYLHIQIHELMIYFS
jgi:hypothetical protein